ncbi:MAG: carotenoid 1,2-hydratase [Deltaproteobacteria bacterium]|nr:carotenoid 1,2-hydratase [Deltaproteobacteria bacterium]
MRAVAAILAVGLTVVAVSACDDGGPRPEPGLDAMAPLDAATDAPGADDGGADATTCSEMPEGRVSLPADDEGHDAPIEWWYWTGHLSTAQGRWFGFEHVFFRFVGDGFDAKMANAAVTDVDDGSFHFISVDDGGGYPAREDGFDLAIDDLSAVGGNGQDLLVGSVDDYEYELELVSDEPPVLQHGDGYVDYPFGGFTYYYSRERMSVRGTLAAGGATLEVSGSGWFDHQWGDLGEIVSVGWDWFSLQLDDGREIMLFVARPKGDQLLVGGTLTDASCISTEIAADDIRITPTGEWANEEGCVYPSGWDLEVAGLALEVTPIIEDQQVVTPTVTYWEGASLVTGDATGRAYVELTGYCR